MDLYNVLSAIQEVDGPVGATSLGLRLNIPPASVGRILSQAENEGYLKQIGNRGRVLTSAGVEFLQHEKEYITKKQSANALIEMTGNICGSEMFQLLTVRKILEEYGVEQACLNASEEEIADIETTLFKYMIAAKSGGGEEEDLQLHINIARASGNQVLVWLLQLILTTDNAYSKFSNVARVKKTDQLCLNQHRAIVEAIQRRDGQAAKKAMGEHLEKVMHDYNINLGGNMD